MDDGRPSFTIRAAVAPPGTKGRHPYQIEWPTACRLELKPESKLRHGSTLALNAADPTSRWLSSMRLDTKPQAWLFS
jgi:hypothetical protein